MKFPVSLLASRIVLCLGLGILGCAGICSAAPEPARETPKALPLVAPQKGQNLQGVRAEIQQKMANIKSLSCTLELSKIRERRVRRKVEVGPLELVRGQGGRLSLTRKGETEEYIANPEIIWVYDHKDKEAKYISTSMPVISTFVREALRLNAFMAVDESTLELRGSQEFEGTPCWVLEGKSPGKLRVVGVPVEKIRVWIAKTDGLPRKIGIPTAKDTTIIFRDISVNPKLDLKRFHWTPPKGVEEKNVFGF